MHHILALGFVLFTSQKVLQIFPYVGKEPISLCFSLYPTVVCRELASPGFLPPPRGSVVWVPLLGFRFAPPQATCLCPIRGSANRGDATEGLPRS